MDLIVPQRALLIIRKYTLFVYFLLPQRQPVFSPFFQHMKINTAVKKTTYTIKNPTLLDDPVTLLLPIKISKIYDKSTVQPCQVTGKPHPKPYFFAGNQISFLSFSIVLGYQKRKYHARPSNVQSFSKIQEWIRYSTDEQNKNTQLP